MLRKSMRVASVDDAVVPQRASVQGVSSSSEVWRGSLSPPGAGRPCPNGKRGGISVSQVVPGAGGAAAGSSFQITPAPSNAPMAMTATRTMAAATSAARRPLMPSPTQKAPHSGAF
jgi:hypothetical protein